MTDLGPIRTALFVPGSRPERVDKALATAADLVIIDLEDAVPPAQKAQARRHVAAKLQQHRGRRLMVRLNALGSEFAAQDLAEIVPAGPLALMVPKVESPEDLRRWHLALAEREAEAGLDPLPLVALIETARGLQDAFRIAEADKDISRLFTLAFGAADYSLDLGIELSPEGQELFYARSRLPIACRAAGLDPPLDSPFMLDLGDLAALQAEAGGAKRLGFQGKLCIHPNQIDIVNRVFSPTADQIAEAWKVMAAFEQAEAEGHGALQVNGKFIDYPVVERARRIVRLASLLVQTSVSAGTARK